MKKRLSIAQLLLLIWMLVIVLALLSNVAFAKESKHPYHDKMIEASTLTQSCFDSIKQYKIQNDIPIVKQDKLQTGIIGVNLSSITTTEGVLQAKRTTCNPNWSAVIIDYFYKANLKSGDEVVFVFSSSFPGLNIAALSAAQVFGLKTAVMISIGASSYGATDTEFTFFDMFVHLKASGLLKGKVDCVSFGGSSDTGESFHDEEDLFIETNRTKEEIKASIRARVEAQGVNFIYQPDFSTNIDKRLEYLTQIVPNAKFLLNVGGSSVGIGLSSEAYIDTGFQDPTTKITSKLSKFDANKDNYGLIQHFLIKQIPVASMLNIRGLAADYGIAYDPDVMPEIGEAGVYTVKQGRIMIAVITIVVSVVVVVFYFINKRRFNVEEGIDERNYILR